MILAIPTVFINEGKSVYSISGYDGLEKYSNYLKENPLELIKILREENNKTLLIHSDNSQKSIDLIRSITELLDIPIQVYINSDSSEEFIKSISKLRVLRVFSGKVKFEITKSHFANVIPVYTLDELSSESDINQERIMIDAQRRNLDDIDLPFAAKASIINSKTTTESLTKFHISNTTIDSVYLGKEYYGVHYVGQLLWRIAELEQLSR
ncbi:MAG: hypothetical protein ACE364_01250 [Chlorobiota bacterium]